MDGDAAYRVSFPKQYPSDARRLESGQKIAGRSSLDFHGTGND